VLRRRYVAAGETCTVAGWPIPAAVAAKLAQDAVWHAVLTDGVNPLLVTSPNRTVRAAVRRALAHRDGTRCVVPGCEASRHRQIHHWRTDYHLGGPTELDNLAMPCWWHHDLITHRGYRLVGGPGRWQLLAPGQPDPTPPAPPQPAAAKPRAPARAKPKPARAKPAEAKPAAAAAAGATAVDETPTTPTTGAAAPGRLTTLWGDRPRVEPPPELADPLTVVPTTLLQRATAKLAAERAAQHAAERAAAGASDGPQGRAIA
jgi:hypothetical protein